jgi:O-antigen/teichoic acid export membrane protein
VASEIFIVSYMIYLFAIEGYLPKKLNFGLLKKIVITSLPFFVVGVISTIYTSLDTTMISKLATPREVGLYGSAVRLKGVFLMLIPVLFGAFMPLLAKARSESIESGAKLFQKTYLSLLQLTTLMSLTVLVFGNFMSDLLFGTEFSASAQTISYLALALYITYLTVIKCVYMNIATDGKILMWITLLSLAINGALNFFLIPWGFTTFGEGGAGVGASISTLISEMFVFWSLVYFIRDGIFTKTICFKILLSLFPFVLMLSTYSIWMPFSFVQKLVTFILAVPLYMILTRLLKWEDVHTLKNLVLKRGA